MMMTFRVVYTMAVPGSEVITGEFLIQALDSADATTAAYERLQPIFDSSPGLRRGLRLTVARETKDVPHEQLAMVLGCQVWPALLAFAWTGSLEDWCMVTLLLGPWITALCLFVLADRLRLPRPMTRARAERLGARCMALREMQMIVQDREDWMEAHLWAARAERVAEKLRQGGWVLTPHLGSFTLTALPGAFSGECSNRRGSIDPSAVEEHE